MPIQIAHHVTYVGDGGSQHYALVVKDHGGGTLDLAILSESGVQIETSVPRRDPGDYGAEGGGRTWH